MNAKTKSAGATARQTPKDKAELPESTITELATLLHRNVERLVGLQKATLDALSSQTTDIAETARKSSLMKSSPFGTASIDLTKETMGTWVEAQKNALETVVQQSDRAVKATREDSGSASLNALGELFQQAAERTIEAQKTMLNLAAKQTNVLSEAVRRETGAAGMPETGVADLMQRGVAALVDIQKDFLDRAGKIGKTAANVKF